MEGSPRVTVGPLGGNGGTRFEDDGDYDGITEISIFSSDCINAINVVYSKNGVLVDGGNHGGDGGSLTTISIGFPDEHIVGVSGHIGCKDSMKVVKSLTLTTNKARKFGPFGQENGFPFSVSIEEGRIVSFIGHSGDYLDAIGFRIRA